MNNEKLTNNEVETDIEYRLINFEKGKCINGFESNFLLIQEITQSTVQIKIRDLLKIYSELNEEANNLSEIYANKLKTEISKPFSEKNLKLIDVLINFETSFKLEAFLSHNKILKWKENNFDF
jgi:hypothetical protein